MFFFFHNFHKTSEEEWMNGWREKKNNKLEKRKKARSIKISFVHFHFNSHLHFHLKMQLKYINPSSSLFIVLKEKLTAKHRAKVFWSVELIPIIKKALSLALWCSVQVSLIQHKVYKLNSKLLPFLNHPSSFFFYGMEWIV